VVQALNERFIPVRQYQVTGAPTTILFSPEGEEKHRFAGFYPSAEYLKELAKGG
jgi:thioredoxin-related protein